jgi:hypothetical protein
MLDPDCSSPIVVIYSIVTCLAVTVHKGGYNMTKVDVKEVFMQTEMTSTPVYIKFSKRLMVMAVQILHTNMLEKIGSYIAGS